VVGLGDGTLGFWTSSGSGKAKRLAHTAKVTIQPCDARGRVRPGSDSTSATARLVAPPDATYVQIQQRVRAKYGAMTKFTHVLGVIGGIVKRKRIPYGDRGVVLTLAP
jgi:PPOX class probable F420-dependent enzyme